MNRHPFRSSPPLRYPTPQLAEAASVAAKPTIVPRFYHVDGRGIGWMVVCDRSLRRARSRGVAEFGRGGVRAVRVATEKDVDAYCQQSRRTRYHLVEDWRDES